MGTPLGPGDMRANTPVLHYIIFPAPRIPPSAHDQHGKVRRRTEKYQMEQERTLSLEVSTHVPPKGENCSLGPYLNCQPLEERIFFVFVFIAQETSWFSAR